MEFDYRNWGGLDEHGHLLIADMAWILGSATGGACAYVDVWGICVYRELFFCLETKS